MLFSECLLSHSRNTKKNGQFFSCHCKCLISFLELESARVHPQKVKSLFSVFPGLAAVPQGGPLRNQIFFVVDPP